MNTKNLEMTWFKTKHFFCKNWTVVNGTKKKLIVDVDEENRVLTIRKIKNVR